MSNHFDQQHEAIAEIAAVLAEGEGKTLADVWNEAVALYRERFAREVRPPPDKEKRREAR